MTKPDLSPRQRAFVVALLGGATVADAANAAGVTERTGYRYLADPNVKQELRERQDQAVTLAVAALADLSQEAIEALRESLALLEDHAGATVAEFITIDGAGQWGLDLAAAEAAGKLHLVKKLWTDAGGNDRLELHDPQAAAARLGKMALDILAERRKAAELDDLAERVSRLEELQERGSK